MTDLINDAIAKARSLNTEMATTATTQLNSATTAASAAAQAQINNAQNVIENLPIDKDPELIKRQAEAAILKKKAEVEELVALKKEEAIQQLKTKLSSLTVPSIPFPPKLPSVNAALLQGKAILQQAKELAKQKAKESRENLEKGIELYSFPVTTLEKVPPPELPNIQPPKVPQLPKVPDLPLNL